MCEHLSEREMRTREKKKEALSYLCVKSLIRELDNLTQTGRRKQQKKEPKSSTLNANSINLAEKELSTTSTGYNRCLKYQTFAGSSVSNLKIYCLSVFLGDCKSNIFGFWTQQA